MNDDYCVPTNSFQSKYEAKSRGSANDSQMTDICERKGQKANSNTTGRRYNLSPTFPNEHLAVQGRTVPVTKKVGDHTQIQVGKIVEK
jgi:hypothetical protein